MSFTIALMIITLVFSNITAIEIPKRPKPKPEELDSIFRHNKIVPRITPFAPNDLLDVRFMEKEAEYGNRLSALDTAIRPKIAFNDSDDSREDDSLYTLMLFNADYGNPLTLLWLVTNIVGDGYPTKGDQTFKYQYFKGPEPRDSTMVFLVYRQSFKERMVFDPKDILTFGLARDTFDLLEFRINYNFTKYPTAGNLFHLKPFSLLNIPSVLSPWMMPIVAQWELETYQTP